MKAIKETKINNFYKEYEMSAFAKIFFLISILVSISAVITWQATGGDYYTKYEVIEQVKIPIDQNDPLAAVGFYDSNGRTETIIRNEFRMGLLPTPSRIFDKHIISVVSAIVPFWLVTIILIWKSRRQNRSKSPSQIEEQG